MLTIRDAATDDMPTIVEFNRLLAEETEGKRLDAAVLERGVRRALERHDMCRYFVAERGGQLVGQTMITYELTDWRDGVLWWIQSVYVRGDARGQGVFRALFEHVERLARGDAEARGLRLYVAEHNAAALATYERLGLRPSGHRVYEIDWS
ncbi:MAG TPA: GNAT family N-acetyltransferase [Pirellulales bacterium]|jgi:ribosomal protein S18 acetylase RimI-like enzyme|nr:GNAT family N-acetyltransferase [Pirellulales bacterium]